MSTLSVFDAAREAPDALAFTDGSRSVTFREAAQRTAPRAAWLRDAAPHALAVTPRADADSVLWLYAALACGVPLLPLHARLSPEEKSRLLALGRGTEPLDLDAAREVEQATFAAPAAPAPTQTLALVPTSGSTGAPRLVRLSHAAVSASAQASAQNLGWEPDDRWLLCLPLAHLGGLSIVTRCLLGRRTVLLFEPGGAGLLPRVRELASLAEQATLISLVPSVLTALLDAGFVATPRLRALLLGGAACSPSLAQRAHAAGLPLLTSYGLTETASQVVTRRYAERFEPLPVQAGVASSGHALSDVELRLVDGRIALRSPSLFAGYAGEAGAALDRDGFLLTNDHGNLGPHGELYVRGRLDDVIVSGGENIDPLEVEAALLALPGVDAVCVFGTASAQFGEVVSAVLVTRDPRLSEPKHLTHLLGGQLARHKHPRRALGVAALPLNASGKVDRRACKALHTSALERG